MHPRKYDGENGGLYGKYTNNFFKLSKKHLVGQYGVPGKRIKIVTLTNFYEQKGILLEKKKCLKIRG